MWRKWMHVHHASAASLESWVCCLWKGCFTKVSLFPNQCPHTGVSGYTGETVLMGTGHVQTRTAAWSKPVPEQFPQPAGCYPYGWQSAYYIHCSKHLDQALFDFSDTGQKFKYCFKGIKKLRTKNIFPIKRNCCPVFYAGDRNNHCIKVSKICLQIQHMSVQDFRSQTLDTCRRRDTGDLDVVSNSCVNHPIQPFAPNESQL